MTLRALLGPTNTGKTWVALEELCAEVEGGLGGGSGVIGFPLRLLAREAYDKLCLRLGRHRVALVTGEEKIVPPGARAFACTVEAMPRELPSGHPFGFVAIDEIQLCADRERGHVFTDRLLHLRGTRQTLVMGQDTIAPILRRLFRDIEIESRPRLSTLSFSGEKKLSRLPKRSAVVCFSVKDVYALAEEVRHHHGGAAVVTGALSPSTRNAQVKLFQDGEVDVLVATDAIGMGLNLDIEHVAFAALKKFDGDDVRALTESEVAQIAGRAGRHLKDGTFGTCTTQALGTIPPFPWDVVERLEHHRFPPLSSLSWRNSDLDFSSLAALHASLRAPPDFAGRVEGRFESGAASQLFQFGRPASDLLALERLMHEPAVLRTVRTADDVEAFFACCQIPDFEKLSPEDHASTILEVWQMRRESRSSVSGTVGSTGLVDDEWMARRLQYIDDISGDVETLVARLAKVRTLAYVAHKTGWTRDEDRWQRETRVVEDALSDALHERLQQRFVDRLARVVVKGDVKAAVADDGAVSVGGETIGRLSGLRFTAEADAGTDPGTISGSRKRRQLQTSAAAKGLEAALQERVTMLLEADVDDAPSGPVIPGQPPAGKSPFDVDAATLRVTFAGDEVGRLVKGRSRLWPRAVALPGAFDAALRARLDEKLTAAVRAWVKRSLPKVCALDEDERVAPLARAWAHALVEGLGVCSRDVVQEVSGPPDDDARRTLRRHNVRLGFVDAWVGDAFKDKGIRCRAALLSVWNGAEPPPAPPPPGASSFALGSRPRGFVEACGFHVLDVAAAPAVEGESDKDKDKREPGGPRAFRADLVDDVAVLLKGFPPPFSSPAVGCEKLGCSHEALAAVLQFLGYRAERSGEHAGKWSRRRGR